MQKPDPTKRLAILRAAEKLFESRPFHEVVLDDVARRARIGKGTIYIYFRSKEDLYATLVTEALTELVVMMRREIAGSDLSSMQQLELVIRRIAEFAASRPCVFHLARMVLPKPAERQLLVARSEVTGFIAETITDGVRQGELCDERPALTAQYLLGSIRSAILFGDAKSDIDSLSEHLSRVFRVGLSCR